MTSKGGKNRKVAQETQLSVTDVSQSMSLWFITVQTHGKIKSVLYDKKLKCG